MQKHHLQQQAQLNVCHKMKNKLSSSSKQSKCRDLKATDNFYNNSKEELVRHVYKSKTIAKNKKKL
jgi:hypothetical protein